MPPMHAPVSWLALGILIGCGPASPVDPGAEIEPPADTAAGGSGGTTTPRPPPAGSQIPISAGGPGGAGAADPMLSGAAGQGAGGSTPGAGGAPPAADGGPPPDAAIAGDAGPRKATDPPPPPATGGAAPMCKHFFCDSFETGEDGTAPPGWSRNGNIVLGSARAARGKKAVRAVNGGINPGNFITSTKVFPPGKTTVYGRMFVWFEKRPQAGGLVHWTAAEVRGAGGPGVRALGGISQAAFKGRNNLLFNIDPGGGERSKEDSFPTPAIGEKVWHCFEWMLTRGAKDEARTWWNDEERPRLTYAGDWGARFKFPSFDQLSLGFATYQNQGAFEVWIDEVVGSDQRIGCAP